MASRKRRNTEKSPARDSSSSFRVDEPMAPSSTVVFGYEGRNILVPRPKSLMDAFELVKKHISQDATSATFLSRVPHAEHEVEITTDAWPLVADTITTFRVQVSSGDNSKSNCPNSGLPLGSQNIQVQKLARKQSKLQEGGSSKRKGQIFVEVEDEPGSKTFEVILRGSDTIASIARALKREDEIPANEYMVFFDGARLDDRRTFSSYNIQDGSTLYLKRPLIGGKPVIYLYPPFPMDVEVGLSLVPEWRFSAIYPLTSICSPKSTMPFTGQQITWNVYAQEDGILKDKVTGSELSYLFWEAETHFVPPISPPASRPTTPSQIAPNPLPAKEFIPGRSVCHPHDSILLQAQAIPYYLDQALLALSLHTEARTSFITYWLPSILKHSYIALRFLHQTSYERAAPLHITPTPDLVTRVFMLFQGVQEKDIHAWSEAEERAKQPVSFWKTTVGVDSVKQETSSLFRVLEWGGMEVF